MADDKDSDNKQKHVIGKPTVGAPGLQQIPPANKQPEQADQEKRKESDGK